jgi:glycosyltransferase involved in cell wall biosynthesis
MEWIIIDDGTDKIEDLVSHLPQVKYFRYDEKMLLGRKRNLAHEKATGDIIVSMDDDDYYPPERVSHAVDMLRTNPKALCAGASEMHVFFKHINQMYRFGPYGPNHSTAATFAFRKELLKMTKFDDNAAVAEEREFLKGYTIPFVQLETTKSILVFSHDHNSFDKKELLSNPNPYMGVSNKKVEDFIKEPDLKQFFMIDIDSLLTRYEPGLPCFKPDVEKQINDIKIMRENMVQEHQRKQTEYQDSIKHFSNDNRVNEMSLLLQELLMENKLLKDKVKYLEDKITLLIRNQMEKARNERDKEKQT